MESERQLVEVAVGGELGALNGEFLCKILWPDEEVKSSDSESSPAHKAKLLRIS